MLNKKVYVQCLLLIVNLVVASDDFPQLTGPFAHYYWLRVETICCMFHSERVCLIMSMKQTTMEERRLVVISLIKLSDGSVLNYAEPLNLIVPFLVEGPHDWLTSSHHIVQSELHWIESGYDRFDIKIFAVGVKGRE